MKVEFFRHQLGEENLKRVTEVCGSLFLTTGAEVRLFEERFASYLGQHHAVGVTSATAALHLALSAMNVGTGDEVITTPLTFVATGLSIMHAGAKPVFVDVEPGTGNIDASLVPGAITERTRAIMPVHLYGQMVDMPSISSIARSHGLSVIEDAAHCIEGSRVGVRVGALSQAACFSFYATKSITCGEGGALTTNDAGMAEMIKRLRLHGMSSHAESRYTRRYRHYDVDVEGWKFNMSNIQAAFLIDQLDRIEEWRSKREAIAGFYRSSLAGVDGLEMLEVLPGVKHAHHLFTILVDPEKRDAILWHLQEEGIGVAVNYLPSHLYTLFRDRYGYTDGDFPHAESIGRRTISLPLYPSLSDAETNFVVDTVKKILRSQG